MLFLLWICLFHLFHFQNDDSSFRSGSPLQMLGKTWSQVKQLREQKVELTKELVSIISRLGKMGQIHDYVSIGDNGKIVLTLREALDMRGKYLPPISSDISLESHSYR